MVGGLYGTYTFRHDRLLINAGATVGAGRCLIGYNLDDDEDDDEETVGTFFVEPHVSLGVAASRWFAVEFQLSAPVFILLDDLELTRGDQTYTVSGDDMFGVTFAAKLLFGKIAEPQPLSSDAARRAFSSPSRPLRRDAATDPS